MPSHITRTIALEDGLAVTVDDDHGTRVAVTDAGPGRRLLTIEADGRALSVTLSTGALDQLDDAIRALTGRDRVAPIVGTR